MMRHLLEEEADVLSEVVYVASCKFKATMQVCHEAVLLGWRVDIEQEHP